MSCSFNCFTVASEALIEGGVIYLRSFHVRRERRCRIAQSIDSLSCLLRWTFNLRGRGRDKEDLVHPQVGVELFQRLAVNKLPPCVSLMPNVEA